MQIAKVHAFPLCYPEPNDHNNTRYIMLTRVETDDGLVGWGEAITMWPEASRAARIIVEDGLRPILLGRDPRDTYAIWLAMREQSWWYGDGGIASFAVSALDIAMWDLKGKALGVPLHQLFGGKMVDRLRACISTHPSTSSIDDMAAELAAYAGQGFTAIKCGFGKKGDAHLGFDPGRDIAFVKAVREATGPGVDFMVDYGHPVRMEVMEAIRQAHAYEEIGIRWLEDPLRTWDWDGYAQLRAAVKTQICTGEDLWTIRDFHRLIKSGVADIVMIDPGRSEGITGYWKVQEMTTHEHRYINAHAWSGAIITAASMHLTAATPNHIVMEIKPFRNPMQHELVKEPFEAQDGYLAVPEKPGLGVDVDEAVVRKYSHD
jgi:L-alanine-DL-glutamate epimerase-like enolase superfamily enzyme